MRPARPQARPEPRRHQRALARTGRPDDGHQRPPTDDVGQGVDHRPASEEPRRIGFAERPQPDVRIRRRRRLLHQSPRVAAASLVGRSPLTRPDRAEHPLRAAHGRPPAQNQLGHRVVATLRRRRPGEHGIQPLGHRSEQPGERGDGPLLGRPGHRRARTTRRGRRTGEQFPQHPGEAAQVAPQTDAVAGVDGDPEVAQVGAAGVIEQHVGRPHVVVGHAGGVGGDQGAAHLLDETAHPGQRPGAAGDHRLAGRAAGEQPEHEVGAARLPPEVVQRGDVGVFEAGDELGLGLEPAHELGGVGQLRADHLDRDPPLGAGLGGRVHPAVGALPDHLVNRVAAQRAARRRRQGVPLEDRSLQRDQLGRRLEAGLVGQPAPELAAPPQRLGVAAGRLQRLHQQDHRTLPERVLDGERLEVRDGPVAVADRDHRRGPLLLGDDAAVRPVASTPPTPTTRP